MKLLLPKLLVGILMTGLFVLTSCSLTLIANDKLIETTCEELEASATVHKMFNAKDGDPFSIYICGDPSTGKRWSIPEIDGVQIVEFDYTEFVVGLDVEDVEDAGEGKRRWRYKALSKGQTILKSYYGIPGSAEPEKTFVLNLAIE